MTREEAKKLGELAGDLSISLADRVVFQKQIDEPVKDSIDRSRRKRAVQDLKHTEERIERLEKQICALACGRKANPGVAKLKK